MVKLKPNVTFQYTFVSIGLSEQSENQSYCADISVIAWTLTQLQIEHTYKK